MKRCYDCHQTIKQDEPVSASARCPHCQQPLHCCCNCHYFSPGQQFDCQQPIEVPIKSKRAANQCERFRLREIESQKKEGDQIKAKHQLDDLFNGL